MKNLIISFLFTCVILVTIFSLYGKKDAVLYLPKRGTNSTKSVQEYFNDFLPHGKVVLMFYADWCNPCKRMCPIIDTIAANLPQFTFLKINRDDFKDLAPFFNVTSIPTLIFLYNGKVLGRYDGKPLSQEKLETVILQTFNGY